MKQLKLDDACWKAFMSSSIDVCVKTDFLEVNLVQGEMLSH